MQWQIESDRLDRDGGEGLEEARELRRRNLAGGVVLGEQDAAPEGPALQAWVADECRPDPRRPQILVRRVGDRQRRTAAETAQDRLVDCLGLRAARRLWEPEDDRLVDVQSVASLPNGLNANRSDNQLRVVNSDVAQIGTTTIPREPGARSREAVSSCIGVDSGALRRWARGQ